MVASVLGEEGFEAMCKEIDEKREVYRFVESERAKLDDAKGEMEREQDMLRRDVFFLRRHVEVVGVGAGASTDPHPNARNGTGMNAGVGGKVDTGGKDNSNSHSNMHVKTSNQEKTTKQPQAAPIDPLILLQREQRRSFRRRNQVARYINEEKQALDVGIWHAASMGGKLRDDVNSLRDEVAKCMLPFHFSFLFRPFFFLKSGVCSAVLEDVLIRRGEMVVKLEKANAEEVLWNAGYEYDD